MDCAALLVDSVAIDLLSSELMILVVHGWPEITSPNFGISVESLPPYALASVRIELVVVLLDLGGMGLGDVDGAGYGEVLLLEGGPLVKNVILFHHPVW